MEKPFYWTIGEGLIEGIPDYNSKIEVDFLMMMSYLRGMEDSLNCKRGNHNWGTWNSRVSKKDDGSVMSIRACNDCGAEMPNSREGQENHKTFEEYCDQNIIMFERLKSINGKTDKKTKGVC